jgi:uncharacterized Ntn-hydrolase superfamily protein
MKKYGFILIAVLACLLTSKASATWSIVAVDRTTGEIGIVGASCTFDVQGIASVVPGKGAIVVQAASDYFARMKGVELMEKDATPIEIINALGDKQFQPDRQQYGVVILNKETLPIVHSGASIKGWNGSKIDNDFAVLGNILVSEVVVKNAFNTFNENRDSSLSERLMLALTAGEQAGGDKRCGAQYARSAFISVYDPKDGAINKISVHGVAHGGQPAVQLLNKKFYRLK